MGHFAKLRLKPQLPVGAESVSSQLIQPLIPPTQCDNHQDEFNLAPIEQYSQSKTHLSLSIGPN